MRPTRTVRGFTLVEALFSATLAALLMSAMLSTYLFLGRNLTRLGNRQAVEAKSRTAMALMNRDIQRASAVSAANSSTVTLTVPGGAVTYTYSNPTLSRSSTVANDAFANAVLLPGICTAFNLSYFSTTGTAPLSGTIVPLSVKRISVSFTVEQGSLLSGTLASQQTNSARLLLRNKQLPNGT
jgi:Tfp pilus assembly protein PilW